MIRARKRFCRGPARVDKLAKSALLKSAARKGTAGSIPAPGIDEVPGPAIGQVERMDSEVGQIFGFTDTVEN
jgi:hypothetical protein